MSYTKQTWTNNVSSIDEDKMNHIEDGIYNNSVDIANLSTDVNIEIEEIKEKIKTIPCCTARGNANIYGNGSTAVKLPLTVIRHNNDNFELSNGGIVCPYKGTVLVTSSAMMSPHAGYAGLRVLRNSNTVADAFFPAGTQTYGVIEDANRFVEVEAGDILYLYGQAPNTDIYQMDNDRSRLTVMYITINDETQENNG